MVGGHSKSTKTLQAILLVIGGIFAGFPILWMICSSFKSNAAIFSWPPKLIDSTFSFHSFTAVLIDASKVRFFLNSYIVAGCVVILTLFIGILAAYAFSRFDFPGKTFFNSLIVSVQAIPPIVLMIPYMSMIVAMKLFNTYWALILTYLIITLPYCILMMTGYFDTLSKELDDAVMEPQARSAAFCARLAQELGNRVLCVPCKDLSGVKNPTVVGLGDAFAGGLLPGLLKQNREIS